MTTNRSMKCSDCGAPLEEKVYSGTIELPCPKCGSLKKTINLILEDEININFKESVRGKIKDNNRTGKAKLRQDFFSGDDLHRNTGKWYKKERRIDKDKNIYKEVVTDPETGEVIRFCEEPLSLHQGHGSAKKKDPVDSVSAKKDILNES